jgi:hypothetical protein
MARRGFKVEPEIVENIFKNAGNPGSKNFKG